MSSCSASTRSVAAAGPNGLPVAVLGAGPVGLAAAAHLLGRGLEPVILEAAPMVGAAPRAWGHVQMFSPWRYNIDRAARALLERHGWTAPNSEAFPTGRTLTECYLEPLACVPDIASRLRLGVRVVAVTRRRHGKVRTAEREGTPFEIRIEDLAGREGSILASSVLDATGTWGNPNPAGAGGITALGERDAQDLIRYGMPDIVDTDRARYAGRRVLVVGCGHSAIGTLIDLAALAEKVPGSGVIWAPRTGDLVKAYGGGAADQLPERGALGQRLRRAVETGAVEAWAPFAVEKIRREAGGGLIVTGYDGERDRTIEVDEMVVATGLRPNLEILREVRLDLDPALECPSALAPLIDPNVHGCGTVRPHGAAELEQPERGLFIVGMKSYGRAPTFLLATGYEQVRSVSAQLAGDIEAARRVELELPETGVCSANGVTEPAKSCCIDPASQVSTSLGSCCGNAAHKDISPAEPAE